MLPVVFILIAACFSQAQQYWHVYRWPAVSAGNTFLDLPPRLLETADNTERYI